MPISITVKHRDGGEAKTQIWPSTEIAFERHFQKPWISAFSTGEPFQEYIYFAAHHAAKEAGKTGLDFDAWIATVAEINLEADTPNPSDPAAQPG